MFLRNCSKFNQISLIFIYFHTMWNYIICYISKPYLPYKPYPFIVPILRCGSNSRDNFSIIVKTRKHQFSKITNMEITNRKIMFRGSKLHYRIFENLKWYFNSVKDSDPPFPRDKHMFKQRKSKHLT